MRTIRALARFLDYKNSFLPLLLFSPFYDRVDKRARGLVRFVTLFSGLRPTPGRERKRKSIQRRLRAINIPSVAPFISDSPPQIEALIVCAAKDLEYLPWCAQEIVRMSINPISRIVVITQDDCVDQATSAMSGMNLEISIFSEKSFFAPHVFESLEKQFGPRYGWILQQLLTVEYVLTSRARGVLTVDADTILTARTQWLDEYGSQILHVSSEFVEDYYKFLNYLSACDTEPEFTHVTHHMLMQPDIMRKIFIDLDLRSSSHLLEKVLAFAESEGQTNFCLEFELYAQSLRRSWPDLAVLQKFGNRTVHVRDVIEAKQIAHQVAQRRQKIFNSVSFHSYARV